MKITEQVLRDMRIAVRKKTYEVGGTEYMTYRAFRVRDPRVWWYDQESWEISLFCQHNHHGEYYLEICPATPGNPDPEFWFCFLKDGRLSRTFLHLRQIKDFDELRDIIRVLTDLELCRNETVAKSYLDENERLESEE